jgi:hypothetical protein
VALPFVVSDATVLALQAGTVALPCAPTWAVHLKRLSGRFWALIPLGSLVVTIFAIRYLSGTATGLTYLALVAVPPLAAVTLGWVMRGARAYLALVALCLFALAWAFPTDLVGQGAGALLCALSCVTLGVLLAAVTPTHWLKAGIVLMAAADTWLVVTDLLQAPNAALAAAAPAGGLPRLQSEVFGSVSLGYGDLFVAAVLGATVAASGSGSARRQRIAALVTFVFAAAFDLLFFAVDELPATVPVALAMLALELWDRRRAKASAELVVVAARRRRRP